MGVAHPQPLGSYAVGCFRARLPPAQPGNDCGLLAQVHYPADASSMLSKVKRAKRFRHEVIHALAKGQGLPPWVLHVILGGRKPLDVAFSPISGAGGGWPIIVFSSGLWGACELYTQFCRELASLGAIVIAIEHEDGSGAFAVDGKTGAHIPYVDPPMDVDAVAFRHPFLERRVEELKATTATIQRMAAKGSDALDCETELLTVLRCGDPEQLLLIGHSFGAAGILRYLRRLTDTAAPSDYRGIILLDSWPDPLLEEDLRVGQSLSIALVISEQWARTRRYVQACRKTMASCKGCSAAVIVRGAYHQWISESSYFAPAWFLRRIGIMGPGQREHVHRVTIKAVHLMVEAMRNVLHSTHG